MTNVEALKNYLAVPPEYTMEKITDAIKQKKEAGEVSECPESTPFLDEESEKCIGCSEENSYMNLKTKKCEICANYDDSKKTCKPVVSGFSNLSNPNWIFNTGEIEKIIKIRDEEKRV